MVPLPVRWNRNPLMRVSVSLFFCPFIFTAYNNVKGGSRILKSRWVGGGGGATTTHFLAEKKVGASRQHWKSHGGGETFMYGVGVTYLTKLCVEKQKKKGNTLCWGGGGMPLPPPPHLDLPLNVNSVLFYKVTKLFLSVLVSKNCLNHNFIMFNYILSELCMASTVELKTSYKSLRQHLYYRQTDWQTDLFDMYY